MAKVNESIRKQAKCFGRKLGCKEAAGHAACVLVIGLLAPLICIVGCSGGTSNSTPAPTPQATAPTISLATGTYTTVQTVTVTGAAGTTVHCTTDGSTPTAASAPCPSTTLSTNGSTTFKAYATESGDTDSSMVSATITINLAVAQTISLPSTMTAILNSTIVLNSSVVTASSSCPTSAVSVTVASTDSNTTTLGSSVLAHYVADGTGATYGSINTGNAFTEDSVNSYNVQATCGSSVKSNISTLTVTDPVPTVTSTSPSIMKCAGGSGTITGTNFSANNSLTLSQWQGTLLTSSHGACPTTEPTLIGSTYWISSTQAQWGFTSSSCNTLGSWNLSVVNNPTATGTGGGWSCLANAYSITVTGMATGGASASDVVSYDPETGTMTIISNGTTTATLLLAKGGNAALATTDAAYVLQPSTNSVAKFNLTDLTLSSIPTPSYTPSELVKDTRDNVYIAATLNSNRGEAVLLCISGNAQIIAPANGITSLSASGSRLLWTAPSQDGQSTVVHVFDTNAAAEIGTVTISQPADHVIALSDGKNALVYQGGAKEVSVVDLDSLTVSGSVTFPAGILGAGDNDRFSLLDGSIGSVTITPDGTGAPQLSWSVLSKQSVEDLYGGFAVSTVNNMATVSVLHRSAQGSLLPQAHAVPAIQQ